MAKGQGDIRDAGRALGEYAREHWPRFESVGMGTKDHELALVYYYDHAEDGRPKQPEIDEWRGWPVVMRRLGKIVPLGGDPNGPPASAPATP